MKKLLIVMLFMALVVVGCVQEKEAEAAEVVKETEQTWRHTHEYTDADTIGEERSNGEQLVVEVGASQNLVQFSEFINLNLAVTKDTLRSGLDDGWTIYVVVSNAKPLIDLRKDKE